MIQDIVCGVAVKMISDIMDIAVENYAYIDSLCDWKAYMRRE